MAIWLSQKPEKHANSDQKLFILIGIYLKEVSKNEQQNQPKEHVIALINQGITYMCDKLLCIIHEILSNY